MENGSIVRVELDTVATLDLQPHRGIGSDVPTALLLPKLGETLVFKHDTFGILSISLNIIVNIVYYIKIYS